MVRVFALVLNNILNKKSDLKTLLPLQFFCGLFLKVKKPLTIDVPLAYFNHIIVDIINRLYLHKANCYKKISYNFFKTYFHTQQRVLKTDLIFKINVVKVNYIFSLLINRKKICSLACLLTKN